MCGISGSVGLRGQPAQGELLQQMSASLAHRGPDASGLHIDREAGLSHARLSILDLAGGAQPMPSSDGSLWITYNGEIFNYIELREELAARGHRFQTRSDTEVILHLYAEYGEDFVHRLNGQWAFAIWDSSHRKLFASRDRVGMQPFFYTVVDSTFLFASEIKALFVHPGVSRELDLRGLDQIFTFWVTLPPRTSFREISQLPPGHNLVVQDGHVRSAEYWTPDFSEIDLVDPYEDAVVKRKAEELHALLSDATQIRLRADIPVGAYLSGGLDSSVITALTSGIIKERLRTFSVEFEDPSLDEHTFQRSVSEFLGTQHSAIRCSSDDIGNVFPEVVRHAEQPLLRAAPAPLFILSKLVHDSGFKVVLTGEGADEALGGYDIFKEAKIRRFWARRPGSRMRPALLGRLYPYMDSIQKQPPLYLANFFRVEEQDRSSPLFSHLPRWQLTAKLKALYSRETRAALAGYDAFDDLQDSLPSRYSSWPSFCQAQYLEMKYLLPGYLLSAQADRMAMAHSVEARYPFLDHRVLEFCQKLSPALKMKVLAEKYLLKRAAETLLPDSILRRPKQPYRAPDGASFVGTRPPEYVADTLSSESVLRTGIFEPSPVEKLVPKFFGGNHPSARDNMALVGAISTQLLIRQFVAPGRLAATTYAIN